MNGNQERALKAIRAAIEAKSNYEMDVDDNEAGATFSRDTYPITDFIDSCAEYGLNDAGPGGPTIVLQIIEMLINDGYLEA